MHILVACDGKYYSKWAFNLLKSIQKYNSHSWLNLHCHIVNSDEYHPDWRLDNVDYTTETYPDVSVPYLQGVRFLVAAKKFTNNERVIILDADSICTREFTKKEFDIVTSDVTVLKHHKELAIHPWLCGFVTLGTDMFRQDYANNLLKLTDSTKITLGTGGDLFFFHDGSNSFLQDAGTCLLYTSPSPRD